MIVFRCHRRASSRKLKDDMMKGKAVLLQERRGGFNNRNQAGIQCLKCPLKSKNQRVNLAFKMGTDF